MQNSKAPTQSTPTKTKRVKTMMTNAIKKKHHAVNTKKKLNNLRNQRAKAKVLQAAETKKKTSRKRRSKN